MNNLFATKLIETNYAIKEILAKNLKVNTEGLSEALRKIGVNPNYVLVKLSDKVAQDGGKDSFKVTMSLTEIPGKSNIDPNLHFMLSIYCHKDDKTYRKAEKAGAEKDPEKFGNELT